MFGNYSYYFDSGFSEDELDVYTENNLIPQLELYYSDNYTDDDLVLNDYRIYYRGYPFWDT
jgi:hypothetical protein